LSPAIGGLGLLVGSRLEADIARCAGEAELIVIAARGPATDFGHAGHPMCDALTAARR
jgi:hypothetical protein